MFRLTSFWGSSVLFIYIFLSWSSLNHVNIHIKQTLWYMPLFSWKTLKGEGIIRKYQMARAFGAMKILLHNIDRFRFLHLLFFLIYFFEQLFCSPRANEVHAARKMHDSGRRKRYLVLLPTSVEDRVATSKHQLCPQTNLREPCYSKSHCSLPLPSAKKFDRWINHGIGILLGRMFEIKHTLNTILRSGKFKAECTDLERMVSASGMEGAFASVCFPAPRRAVGAAACAARPGSALSPP